MFKKIIPWRGPLLWPIRMYVRYFPLEKGKPFLVRNFSRRTLPTTGSFVTTLYGGGTISLNCREVLGSTTLAYGRFEPGEQAFLSKHVSLGATVLDVGAHVGIFTVLLARRVGAAGRVLAFEPLLDNLRRLRENIQLNDLHNVTIFPFAVGHHEGEIKLHWLTTVHFHRQLL